MDIAASEFKAVVDVIREGGTDAFVVILLYAVAKQWAYIRDLHAAAITMAINTTETIRGSKDALDAMANIIQERLPRQESRELPAPPHTPAAPMLTGGTNVGSKEQK